MKLQAIIYLFFFFLVNGIYPVLLETKFLKFKFNKDFSEACDAARTCYGFIFIGAFIMKLDYQFIFVLLYVALLIDIFAAPYRFQKK